MRVLLATRSHGTKVLLTRTFQSSDLTLCSCQTRNTSSVHSPDQAEEYSSSASVSTAQDESAHAANIVNQSQANGLASDARAKANQDKRSYSIPKTILSGIQPTGIPHLGNYLGALRKWKELQDEKTEPDPRKRRNHKLFYSIVDLHSLTLKQDPEERRRLIIESYRSLLAIGLDRRHSHIFVQSHVSAHSELMWILSTIASTGYLSRMTQWKSKLDLDESASMNDSETKEKLKLGLFSYPVLQAADILLYQTDLVPVGEDQIQHVEFTRNLARSFNSHFPGNGKRPVFRKPNLLISPASRVMSLKEPTKKMSKSHADPASRILITDTEEQIRQKIKGATTDSVPGISYDPDQRPGVSNLVDVLKSVTRSAKDPKEIAQDHKDMGLGAFKSMVADEIIKELAGVRDRYEELRGTHELSESIHAGTTGAKIVAGQTLKSAQLALGMVYKHSLND